MKKTRELFRSAVSVVGGIGGRRIPTYAAAGTFFSFLSLSPIVMILCFVIPRTFLTEEMLLTAAYNVLPASVMPLAGEVVAGIYAGRGMNLSLSVIAALWSASLAMAALMRGLRAAYGAERREGFMLFRLKAVFYMAVLIASAVAALCAVVFGQQIILLGLSMLRSESGWRRALIVMKYGRFAAAFGLLTLAFAMIFRFASGTGLKMRRHLRGAAFSAAAWMIFSGAFSFWVTNFTSLGLFGFLGTVIISMLWLYYCLLFLLIGGYINSRTGGNRQKNAGVS